MPAEAERIFSLLRSERKASPIVQHFHVAALALMGKSEQAAAMAARLLSSSLPPQIEFRTERILTHLDNL